MVTRPAGSRGPAALNGTWIVVAGGRRAEPVGPEGLSGWTGAPAWRACTARRAFCWQGRCRLPGQLAAATAGCLAAGAAV